MNAAPFPHNEKERLAALQALDILDTSPEAEFDALVRIASLICDVPISLISLVDTERQWFKANIGLSGVSETPRDVAFCAHAILGNDVLEVPDATRDSRFADNPLVAGNPDIRFYAGAPIVLKDGDRVGTLCVIDRQPKQLDEKQREILQCLALAAAASLEGRRAVRLYKQATQDLEVSEDHLRRLYEDTPAMMHSIDAQGRLKTVSNAWLSRLGYTRDDVLNHYSSEYLTPESREYAKNVVLPTFFKTGRCEKVEYQMVAKDGAIVDVLLSAILEYDAGGQPYRSLTVIEDVTQRRVIERMLALKRQRLAHVIDSTHAGSWEWNCAFIGSNLD